MGILCLCLSLIAGCAAPYGAERDAVQVKNAVDTLYKDADAELARGDREKAVFLLNEAARTDPANVDPWLKIADIRFAAGDYPASILAAARRVSLSVKAAREISTVAAAPRRTIRRVINGKAM